MFPIAVILAGRCCSYLTLGPFVCFSESNAPSKKTRRAGTEAQESEWLLALQVSQGEMRRRKALLHKLSATK